MEIILQEITIEKLAENYEDNDENGVVGFDGKLDIRPPYQREFVYKDAQRDAVIETITKGFPLNVMYWADNGNDTYEIIDGQQRTISICQFVDSEFSYNGRYFHNLQQDEKDQILQYKVMVYKCTGEDSEKLAWFETINIAGEKLTNQELRNAVFSGTWVTDAKRYFSKRNCVAEGIASDYLKGSAIRQEFLETAIKWISNDDIKGYMAKHQNDPNALALWQYFQAVITWVTGTFVTKRTKFMRGVNWGQLYNTFKDEVFDTAAIEVETAALIADDDVEKKSGIYPFLLTRDEKYLGIRAFTDAMKQKVYEKQNGICTLCNEGFDIDKMEGDHITPWHEGGKTIETNCQMLCRDCNRRKSGN